MATRRVSERRSRTLAQQAKSYEVTGEYEMMQIMYESWINPAHITGTYWSSEYDGDDYFRLFPQMVARLDTAEDSKQADEDRVYLMDWYFKAFGTFGIKYNFQDTLSEIACVLEQQCVTA